MSVIVDDAEIYATIIAKVERAEKEKDLKLRLARLVIPTISLNQPYWKLHDLAVLNQAAPVQNDYYSINEITGAAKNLDELEYIRVMGISVGVEDTNESLQCRITADGVVSIPDTFAATHSTQYQVHRYTDGISRTYRTVINATLDFAHMLDAKLVTVDVRKTTATGTGNLVGSVLFATRATD